MPAAACACVRACVRAFMCAFVRSCVRACVRALCELRRAAPRRAVLRRIAACVALGEFMHARTFEFAPEGVWLTGAGDRLDR